MAFAVLLLGLRIWPAVGCVLEVSFLEVSGSAVESNLALLRVLCP